MNFSLHWMNSLHNYWSISSFIFVLHWLSFTYDSHLFFRERMYLKVDVYKKDLLKGHFRWLGEKINLPTSIVHREIDITWLYFRKGIFAQLNVNRRTKQKIDHDPRCFWRVSSWYPYLENIRFLETNGW